MKEQEGDKIAFPLSEAFWISLQQIRKRFLRSFIVITSIVLGVAFMSYLIMTNVIVNAFMRETGASVEAYQFWLVIVSFFVCGISLINATLIAIYERYKEIGTMKCLGALDQHVLKLFFIEAFLFGLIGGVMGFFTGTLVAALSSVFQFGIGVLGKIPPVETLTYMGLTTLLSIVLSTGTTIYPALKAARMNPVEALRFEI
jgi:ABC-type antimicrobial peptide transport system permease subunit